MQKGSDSVRDQKTKSDRNEAESKREKKSKYFHGR